jgi:DNA polymerase I - 3''-5'' exonuclease and polymerase domains
VADDDEFMVTWDHDNIEGRIHDIIVDNRTAIKAHKEGLDLHTITCCHIFGYQLPLNLKNPHTSEEDAAWRGKVHWQGKDTKQRVLAKNFNHGSKYTESYKFVHRIKGIEQYGIGYDQLEELAKAYIKANQEAWDAKLAIMADIRTQKMARSLYGFRRKFFTSDPEVGREGFSHMISGTVSDYNNVTIQAIDSWIGDNCTLLHNAHDGDKFAIKKDWLDTQYSGDIDKFKVDLSDVIQRPISYQGRTLTMTAGIKVHI